MLSENSDLDLNEAQSLLQEYRAALPRCRDGSYLKEEFTRLNLRMFSFGLTFPSDSALSMQFQEVLDATSTRFYQSGIYASMEEAGNIDHWIKFLTRLLGQAGETLAQTKVKPTPI
jgi:hypothetical protein